MNREERLLWLEKEILRHRDLYYNGRPEIADAEFDALEGELRELDPENPVLSGVGAPPPGERGEPAMVGLPTKRHKIPMGSLEKIPEERLEAWAAKAGPHPAPRPRTRPRRDHLNPGPSLEPQSKKALAKPDRDCLV